MVEDRIDRTEGEEETTAPPGTETLFAGSIREEQHPELTPQNPGDFADKVAAEAGDEPNLVSKAKRVVEEMDRDLAGEYQRREDPTAPPPKGAPER